MTEGSGYVTKKNKDLSQAKMEDSISEILKFISLFSKEVIPALRNDILLIKRNLCEQTGKTIMDFCEISAINQKTIETKWHEITENIDVYPICNSSTHTELTGLCKYKNIIERAINNDSSKARSVFMTKEEQNESHWTHGSFMNNWPHIVDMIFSWICPLKSKLSAQIHTSLDSWEVLGCTAQVYWRYAMAAGWFEIKPTQKSCFYRKLFKKHESEITRLSQSPENQDQNISTSETAQEEEPNRNEPQNLPRTGVKKSGAGLLPIPSERAINKAKKHKQDTDFLQSQVQESKIENETLQNRLSVKTEECAASKLEQESCEAETENQSKNLYNESEDEKWEKESLKNDIEDLEKRLRESGEKYEGLQKEVRQLQNSLKEKDEKITALLGKNHELSQESKNNKERSKRQEQQFRSQLHTRDEEIKTLEEKIESLSTAAKEREGGVNRLKSEYDRIEEKCTNLKEVVSELEDNIKRLTRENEDLKIDNGQLNDKLEYITEERDGLKQEVGSLKRKAKKKGDRPHTAPEVRRFDEQKWKALVDRQAERIEEQEKEIEQLGQSKEQILNNMSAQMNAEMSRDESDLENINVKNRPMKILEEYNVFCSDQWLEAKTALDDCVRMEEDEKCRLLVTVMDSCYERNQRWYDEIKQHLALKLSIGLENIVHDKDEFAPSKSSRRHPSASKEKRHHAVLDKDMEVAISKYLKQAADNIDFNQTAKEVSASIFGDLSESLSRKKAVRGYVLGCLEISWKMILQQPPMLFVCAEFGEKYDDKKHDLHFDSANPRKPGARVWYTVHPKLMHGVKQMNKAKVVLTIFKDKK